MSATPKATAPQPKRKLGSVFQRKEDGRWAAAITLPNGKRITRYVAPDHTDPERGAHELLAKLITGSVTGDLTSPSELTVERWLAEYVTRANHDKAASTIRDREYSVNYLNATLGRTRLDRLTPVMVQRWVDTARYPQHERKEHARYAGQPLSHRAKAKGLQLLRSALDEAVALEHLTRNPARPVKLPRRTVKNVGVSWTQDEARQFLQANEGTHHQNLWHLALQTGARIGELLALKTTDYNPQKSTIRIERTVKAGTDKYVRATVGKPKTENANRTVPLPPDARTTIERQLAKIASMKAAAGTSWQRNDWLFPSEVGTLTPYDNAHRAWTQALTRTQATINKAHQDPHEPPPTFPRIRTHDLRVTFISLALRRGVKPEVVARMVGHSSPLITLKIYRQVFDDEMTDAADLIADLV